MSLILNTVRHTCAGGYPSTPSPKRSSAGVYGFPPSRERRTLWSGYLLQVLDCRGGGAMLEFAFAMPVLIGLVMGGIEFARFALVNQKMERVTSFVGDFVARAEALDEADFGDYFAAAQQLGAPFDLFADGNIIVTSVTGESTGPEVLWQQIGAGSVTQSSQVGLPGDAANLPLNFNVDEGEGLVVTEVYFDFEPLLLPGLISAHRLYYQAIYRPRRTAILALQQE